MNSHSLWVLCLLLFADGATFSFATTPLLLAYGRYHPAWQVAVAGSVASALGSGLQLMLLRRLLNADFPWLRRFTPSRERLDAALAKHPSTSFLAILVARATPLPDAPIKLVAAVVHYPIPLYLLAILLGALPYYFALSLIGHEVHLPTWSLVLAVVVLALAVVLDRVRQRRSVRS
jgi:uncharacterized membrane protein YdjX (TVP38/TMEM64 family)